MPDDQDCPCKGVVEIKGLLDREIILLQGSIRKTADDVTHHAEQVQMQMTVQADSIQEIRENFKEAVEDLTSTLTQCVNTMVETTGQIKEGANRFEGLDKDLDQMAAIMRHHSNGEGGRHDLEKRDSALVTDEIKRDVKDVDVVAKKAKGRGSKTILVGCLIVLFLAVEHGKEFINFIGL